MTNTFAVCILLLLAAAAATADEISARPSYLSSFRSKVQKASETVQALLDTTRNPKIMTHDSNADHKWDDKYSVVEFVTNTAIAAEWNALEKLLDLTDEDFAIMQQWVHRDKKNVKLRFTAEDTFDFYKEVVANIDLGKTDDQSLWESVSRNKVVTTRTEYHWKATVSYKIQACPGSCGGNKDEHEAITLVDRKRSTTIITLSKEPPFPRSTIQNPEDLYITWLLQQTKPGERISQFRIDRESESTRTPSRNQDIEKAFSFQSALERWTYGVRNFIMYRVQQFENTHTPAKPTKRPSLRDAPVTSVFGPILPLMENSTTPAEDVAQAMLNEQVKTLQDVQQSLEKIFPSSDSVDMVSVDEACVVLFCTHLESLSNDFKDAIGFVETSLREQLVQAIGKEITRSDFDKFMQYYNRKLFHADFIPKPFSQAIRRPDHYPDGILSIESSNQENEPVETLVRHVSGSQSTAIQIPISAATSVEMTGDRYLHGWMEQRFERGTNSYILAARARQFSSFLVLVGTMTGPDTFTPKDAIILQNKDEVLIPLLTKVLPSAKEFKDAIASLSPEQQEFAKEFRGMQLASSVFGVCVIQLKPQLERLLRLPDGALTKEIRLTQDLMSLFVEYQIPSDLLSYDGSQEASVMDKVEAVKSYVKAVMDMISKTKEEQLKEEAQKAEMRFDQKFYDQEQVKMYASYQADTANLPSTRPSSSPSAGPSATIMRSATISSSYPSVTPSGAPSGGSGAQRRMLESAEEVVMMAAMMDEDVIDLDAAPMEKSGDKTQDGGNADVATTETSAAAPYKMSGQDDFTLIPKLLDMQLEQHDKDGALKSVIIETESLWIRNRQENLLSSMKMRTLHSDDIAAEQKKAMDLLDAISRSGSLPIEASELHIIIGVAHCFDKSIIDTVVQDNVNPIAKMEHSLLLLASTIYGDRSSPVGFLESGTAARGRLEAALPSYFVVEEDVSSRSVTAKETLSSEDESSVAEEQREKQQEEVEEQEEVGEKAVTPEAVVE